MPEALNLLFFVGILVLMWLVLLRPARKQQRAQQELIASLNVGDEVVLSSGIFGTIAILDDNRVGLEVAPGTVLTVARQAVVRRVEDEAATETEAPASASADTEEN